MGGAGFISARHWADLIIELRLMVSRGRAAGTMMKKVAALLGLDLQRGSRWRCGAVHRQPEESAVVFKGFRRPRRRRSDLRRALRNRARDRAIVRLKKIANAKTLIFC